MDPARWDRIQSLFHEAADMPHEATTQAFHLLDHAFLTAIELPRPGASSSP